MPQYDFKSPAGQAGDAILQLLAQRKLEDRQKMIDDLNRRNVESQIDDRSSARRLQEADIGALDEQRKAISDERNTRTAAAKAQSKAKADLVPVDPTDTPTGLEPVDQQSFGVLDTPLQPGHPGIMAFVDKDGKLTTEGRTKVALAGLNPQEIDKDFAPSKPAVEPVDMPVMRIGRNGKMENIGSAPKGSHFVNEPAPPAGPSATATDNRHDKSYQYNNNLLEKAAAPLEQQAQRLERLRVSVEQRSPQADSLIAPELLTAMAGGQGSGLRMNEAEIARIIGGRSNWESIKAAVNKWKPGDAALTITDAQRADIYKLVQEMSHRVDGRLKDLDQGRLDLIDAPDVDTHRRIVQRVKKALAATEAPAENTATPEKPVVKWTRDAQGRAVRVK